MENIQIKRATEKDINDLQKIARQTFYEAYSDESEAEEIDKYMDEKFSIDKLTAEINDKNSEFYFAVLENEMVGYLKVNTGDSQTVLQEKKALEIERIYVLKKFYGKEVGQLLFEKAKQAAEEKDAGYIWLGVWEKNLRAINFYKKNGFVEVDKHIFQFGNEKQTDLIMKLQLKAK